MDAHRGWASSENRMVYPESSDRFAAGEPTDALRSQLRQRQQFVVAALAGIVAGVIGGFIWGAITGISGLHVEFVCLPMVGIGLLVGKAMAFFGRGVDLRFAWLGAIIATLACLAGYVFSVIIAVAWQVQIGSNFLILETRRFDALRRLFVASLGWPDLVCLCIAAYEGFRFSRLPITKTSLLPPRLKWSPTLVIVLLSIPPAVVGLTWLSVSRKTIKSIAVADQGQLAVLKRTLDGHGEVEVWDLPNQKLLAVVGRENPAVQAMAMSPKNETIATVTRKTESQPRPGEKGLHSFGVVEIWNKMGKGREKIPEPAITAAKLALTTDGRRVLFDTEKQSIAVWKAGGQMEGSLPHDGKLDCMAVDSTGQTLVLVAFSTLHVWDLQAKQERKTISLGQTPAGEIALSGEGSRLAVVMPFDHSVEIFDVNGGKAVATLESNQDWLTAVSFSPDGKTLAVGGGSFHRSGCVELWDVAGLRKIKELEVRTNTVRCLAFAANGKEIIAGSSQSCRLMNAFNQGDVHRWNATTGEPLPALGN